MFITAGYLDHKMLFIPAATVLIFRVKYAIMLVVNNYMYIWMLTYLLYKRKSLLGIHYSIIRFLDTKFHWYLVEYQVIKFLHFCKHNKYLLYMYIYTVYIYMHIIYIYIYISSQQQQNQKYTSWIIHTEFHFLWYLIGHITTTT